MAGVLFWHFVSFPSLQQALSDSIQGFRDNLPMYPWWRKHGNAYVDDEHLAREPLLQDEEHAVAARVEVGCCAVVSLEASAMLSRCVCVCDGMNRGLRGRFSSLN